VVKVFISNCYVSNHILYSKYSNLLLDALASSWLGSPLHHDTLSNGFLQQSSSDLLQCILQLGNCFGYNKVFVAIAISKNID